jgi:DNA-binding response OmpR family regulator
MTLTDRLSREGYAVEASGDGESGLERASAEAFDLVLLDVMLPRLGGFDVMRELRRRGIETPVIMLTARGQVVDKVIGLKLGADDYVTKPFEMMEFKLLRHFIEHRGATLSREELLNEVWGYNSMPTTRTVDVHVAWLRQKIEPNPRHPQYILTVHGMGYKFAG